MRFQQALLALALLPAATGAQALDFALGVKASTLGGGLEGTVGINKYLNARAGVNVFSHNFDSEIEDIDYDLDLDLRTVGGLLDVHPFGGAFRLTGGVFYNGNGVDGNARPSEPVRIGETEYSPDEVGTLSADGDFNKVAPYLGLGWGNAVGEGGHFGVNFEVGVLFQGSADVDLRAEEGTLADSDRFQDDLRREEADLNDDAEDFKFYPVVGLGLSYKF